jgi:Tfp pilus assembly protein PilP
MTCMPTMLLVALLAVDGGVQAQAPAPQPKAEPSKAAPAPSPAPPAPSASDPGAAPSAAQTPEAPESFTYSPDGRRDPFTSLLGTGGVDMRGAALRRSDGPGTMAVADISVRGVLQTRGALLAMIQGPDNRTYIVHQGDKLLDGTIKAITTQGLIVIQDVNDPLSLVKQREVSKLLRSVEAVK